MPPKSKETSGEPAKFEQQETDPEYVKNAVAALEGFVALKPEERVIFLTDDKTNPETLDILRQAVEKIGCAKKESFINDEVKKKEVKKMLQEAQVIINVMGEGHKSTRDIYDNLEKDENRMLALYESEPDIFAPEGALSESRAELEDRLNRMEVLLREAKGFNIKSSYGTDLKVGIRPFGERRWAKDTGVIDTPGQWDNLPGGEIYTTPDESKVNGILVLPALETDISNEQGVDELVRLEIKDGLIINISGGQSAEKLRKHLEEGAKEEVKEGSGNAWNVKRIAEIGFGANSKARYTVKEGDPTAPAVPTVEAEKRFGTMHLAFGDSKHGEEGVEGFEEAIPHLDFVLPRTGLEVEMFNNDKDFKNNKNGRYVLRDGGFNFS